MKQFIPDYLNSFKCIADKCRHSCCIGWEIDIDKNTLDFYKSIDDDYKDYFLSDNSITYGKNISDYQILEYNYTNLTTNIKFK